MGKAHTLSQSARDTKNDRSTCFSEILVVVAKDGKMFRRRTSRWVCGSVGGLVGRRPGHLSTLFEREPWSFIFCKEWLSPIAFGLFADINIIDGCKSDLILLQIHKDII